MQPFERLKAVALTLRSANVDTDQIVPARFLARTREDIGAVLFHDLRHDAQGALEQNFVMNQSAFYGAQILVALQNFGCGSSREAAVWALEYGGFRAVLAPSFGDIFYSNCFKNGILPVRLRADQIETLLDALQKNAGGCIEIDLERQSVEGPEGFRAQFEIDAFLKNALLTGSDELSMTLTYIDQIKAFECTRAAPFDPRRTAA